MRTAAPRRSGWRGCRPILASSLKRGSGLRRRKGGERSVAVTPDHSAPGQIPELSGTIRQLQRSSLGDAAPQLLISRKRAELDDLLRRTRGRREGGTGVA